MYGKRCYIQSGRKHIILRPSAQERRIAIILSEKYGKTVELVSRILFPQGIQTPDYLIDGVRFDLKTITSVGKNVMYNMVSKEKRQAPNFIFDVTNCALKMGEIESQIKSLYSSTHTRFIEKIVIVRNEEILKAYCR